MDVKFDEGNVLQPDILYISKERKSEIIKDRVEGAPDLIIEILLNQMFIVTFVRKKTFTRSMV
jgi:Uma2 family endonuclease